jgi:hypothetical protein
MTHIDFLNELKNYIDSLEQDSHHQFGMWSYLGVTNQSFGTPGGAWDSKKYKGFRFKEIKDNYEFILRPVPDLGYLVIESVLGFGQLANVDLSKESKFKIDGNKGFIFEDYTMTVGLGRRKVDEIKTEFHSLGFNNDGLISSFDTVEIDWPTLIVNILNWSSLREEVKKSIQSKKSDENIIGEENNSDESNKSVVKGLFRIKGKVHSHRDKIAINPVLGVEAIAESMSKQIESFDDEEGQMVGVFGRWGRGKTFFIRELSKKLGFDYNLDFQKYNSKRKFELIKVHAWKYRESNAFWAYLYQTLAEQYYKSSKIPLIGELYRIIRLNCMRMGLMKFLKLLIPLLISIIWWSISFDSKLTFLSFIFGIKLEMKSFEHLIKGIINVTPLLISIFLFFKNVLPKASKLFTEISKKHHFNTELGFQARVQDEIKILLKSWIGKSKLREKKKVLIIVDDLDRCDIDNILLIADALRVILEDREIIIRTIVVCLVDERILIQAIKNKYENLNDQKESLLISEYMDKLFISGIKLPELLDEEKSAILDSITKDHVLPEYPRFISKGEEIIVQDRILTEPKINTDKTESNFKTKKSIDDLMDDLNDDVLEKSGIKITRDELELLDKYVRRLIDPTPRQIKIFYYRYLLFKLLDEIDEFQLYTKFGEKYFQEIAIYLLWKRASNETEFNSIDHLSEEFLTIAGSNVKSEDYLQLKKLIDMVVPY